MATSEQSVTTVYFARPDEAEDARVELISMGVPQNAIEVEVHDETLGEKVKRLFGTMNEDAEGAIMHVRGTDMFGRVKIEEVVSRHNAHLSEPEATDVRESTVTEIPVVRSSTGVPVVPVSEREESG
jgi:hypothetical protein